MSVSIHRDGGSFTKFSGLAALIDGALGSAGEYLLSAGRAWAARRSRRRTLWELQRLGDRQLADIGLSRPDLETALDHSAAAAAAPFSGFAGFQPYSIVSKRAARAS